jgi:NADH dehydrogenase
LILLTGGSGRLGRRLVPALRAAGWRVRCLVRDREVPEADERARGSLGDTDSLVAAANGVTAVMHVAALTHARRAFEYTEANKLGTRNLVEAAEAEGVEHFVLVSTRAIDPRGGAYSRSKAEAEAIVRRSSTAHTIMRLPEVYGAGGSEGLDQIISLVRADARVPIVGRGEDVVCPMYVDDAVAACVGGLERAEARGNTYTLAGDCLSTRAFAEEVVRAFSSSSSIVGVPRMAVWAASMLARFAPLPIYPDQLERLSAPKPPRTPEAERELGFSYRPLRDGLRRLTDDPP